MHWLEIEYIESDTAILNDVIKKAGLTDIGRLPMKATSKITVNKTVWQDEKGRYYEYKLLRTSHVEKKSFILLKRKRLSALQISQIV